MFTEVACVSTRWRFVEGFEACGIFSNTLLTNCVHLEWEWQPPVCSSFQALAEDPCKVLGKGTTRPATAGTAPAVRQGQSSLTDYAVEFRTVSLSIPLGGLYHSRRSTTSVSPLLTASLVPRLLISHTGGSFPNLHQDLSSRLWLSQWQFILWVMQDFKHVFLLASLWST